MKKKILFVQESLRLAGSEKSMVTLLKHLDANKYEIDIQLMSYGGELEKEVPEYINFLPPLEYKRTVSQSLFAQVLSIRNKKQLHYLFARLKYSFRIRLRDFNHSQKAKVFWESVGRTLPFASKEYDAVIAYAQGFPTFYVLDKVQASKKFCWINANMVLKGRHKEFQEHFYKGFDNVICITEKTKSLIQEQIPSLNNLMVLENIVDYKEILKASAEKVIEFSNRTTNILTVGRLNNSSKGMDIAINSAVKLRNKDIDFHWYFIGAGPYKENMESIIKEHKLENQVSLLGTYANPYPYFVASDIYVQTSRKEGFGRTIAEARLLNKPVITTRFDSVSQQMIHEQNGLITDMNPEAVADAIERLMKDKTLYNSIKAYLEKEPKENLESVEKFDRLIFGEDYREKH